MSKSRLSFRIDQEFIDYIDRYPNEILTRTQKLISILKEHEYFKNQLAENPASNKSTRKKSSAKKPSAPSEELQTFRDVRDAYLSSYFKRYAIKPTFAAKENSLVKSLIKNVGREEAIKLAGAYPWYNDAWHVKQKHPFGLLVTQINKVRVELQNPNRMFDHIDIEKQARNAAEKISVERNRERYLKSMEDVENNFRIE